MCINAKVTPDNNTDYNCHFKAVELVKPIIWVHNMSVVINDVGGHTHTNTKAHILTLQTKAILRNQAHAWFNNIIGIFTKILTL